MKKKKFLCTVMVLLLCVMPILQPMILKAEGTEKYPYTLFAASDKEGAITANTSNSLSYGMMRKIRNL